MIGCRLSAILLYVVLAVHSSSRHVQDARTDATSGCNWTRRRRQCGREDAVRRWMLLLLLLTISSLGHVVAELVSCSRVTRSSLAINHRETKRYSM